MAGTIRDASLHFIHRYPTSTAITRIGHKLSSYSFRTLNLLPPESQQGRGSQGHNYNGNVCCSARPFSGGPADDASTKFRFGHFVDEQGNMVKKPQLLYAKIGNHVELGANVCIDRGSWRDTEVGDHTKIDNLVQIGHNVVIGRCCMLCGQVGVAGSVTMGDYVVLGGKSGVADHVSIVSKVRLAAKSCVTKNIVEPGDYAGFPAVPIHEWRKSMVARRKIARDPKL